MKFQIGIRLNPLQGYTVLDMDPIEGYPKYTGDIGKLPCQDGQCTEILADNIINYVQPKDLKNLFNSWFIKLRYDHILCINCVESMGLCRSFLMGDLSIEEFNHAVYSQGALHTREYIFNLLKDIGFKIIYQNTDGFNFTVKAKKC